MLDKQMARIEAKLDALLEKQGIKPADFDAARPTGYGGRAAPKLSAAEQQAIDNAPETPTGANAPAMAGARVDAATNAPLTPAAQPKSGAKSK